MNKAQRLHAEGWAIEEIARMCRASKENARKMIAGESVYQPSHKLAKDGTQGRPCVDCGQPIPLRSHHGRRHCDPCGQLAIKRGSEASREKYTGEGDVASGKELHRRMIAFYTKTAQQQGYPDEYYAAHALGMRP